MALSGLGFLFGGGGGAFWVWRFRICSVWGVRGVVQFLSGFVWGAGGYRAKDFCMHTHPDTRIYIYIYAPACVSVRTFVPKYFGP